MVQYGLGYQVAVIDGVRYLVGWHNRKIFMVPLEKYAELFAQMPGFWKKYDPCWTLLIPPSLLFAYALHVLIDELLGVKESIVSHRADGPLCYGLNNVSAAGSHPQNDVIRLYISGSIHPCTTDSCVH